MNITLHCILTDLHRAIHQCKYMERNKLLLSHILSPYKTCYIVNYFVTDITNAIKYPTDERLDTFIPFNHPRKDYKLPAQNVNFYVRVYHNFQFPPTIFF